MDRVLRLKSVDCNSEVLFPKSSNSTQFNEISNSLFCPSSPPLPKLEDLISLLKLSPNIGQRQRSSSCSQMDRFIPRRSSNDMEVAQFKISHSSELYAEGEDDDDVFQKSRSEVGNNVYWDKIRVMSGKNLNQNILNFSCRPKDEMGLQGGMKSKDTVHDIGQLRNYRYLSRKVEKSLDLPFFTNVHRFNLLDWNHNETSSSLLIGLNNSAFIVDKTISKNLLPICLQAEEGCFASVRWIERGLKFALGTDKGMIQVRDTATLKRIITLNCNQAEVYSLAWNPPTSTLSSGDSSSNIRHFDIRSSNAEIKCFNAFSRSNEVSELSFSSSGRYLAAGGAHTGFSVYEGLSSKCYFQQNTHLDGKHCVAWCPWRPSTLATGCQGPKHQGHIATWNVHSAERLSHVETNGRVSGLLWNELSKELVSGHGHLSDKIQIWKNSSELTSVGCLPGQQNQAIFNMTFSPDWTRLATTSSNAKLKIWPFVNEKKQRAKSCEALTALNPVIR